MLVRAGELRLLALLQAASDSTISNFSFASPRGQIMDPPMTLVRARFVLVVSVWGRCEFPTNQKRLNRHQSSRVIILERVNLRPAA